MRITIGLDPKDIGRAIKQIKKYAKWIDQNAGVLAKKVAQHGAGVADPLFKTTNYVDYYDVTVGVSNKKPPAPNVHVSTLYATGDAAVFIEFGAGAALGYGHPDAGANAYHPAFGPGTYPNAKGHWNAKDKQGNWLGWFTPRRNHTFGNPPAKAMYTAQQQMAKSANQIARQVFT